MSTAFHRPIHTHKQNIIKYSFLFFKCHSTALKCGLSRSGLRDSFNGSKSASRKRYIILPDDALDHFGLIVDLILFIAARLRLGPFARAACFIMQRDRGMRAAAPDPGRAHACLSLLRPATRYIASHHQLPLERGALHLALIYPPPLLPLRV